MRGTLRKRAIRKSRGEVAKQEEGRCDNKGGGKESQKRRGKRGDIE